MKENGICKSFCVFSESCHLQCIAYIKATYSTIKIVIYFTYSETNFVTHVTKVKILI